MLSMSFGRKRELGTWLPLKVVREKARFGASRWNLTLGKTSFLFLEGEEIKKQLPSTNTYLFFGPIIVQPVFTLPLVLTRYKSAISNWQHLIAVYAAPFQWPVKKEGTESDLNSWRRTDSSETASERGKHDAGFLSE